MATSIHVDVVSAETSVFSGEANVCVAARRDGRAGHLPAPHPADHAHQAWRGGDHARRHGEIEIVAVAGGLLEVQPSRVTVLADTAVRGKDVDEAKANEAKARAAEAMKNAKNEIDFATAQGEFAMMAAQIAALQKLRRK